MVSSSKRVLNLLIDSFCYLLLVVAVGYSAKSFVTREVLYWILIIMYYLYYLLGEFFFGQTIGKRVTKTKVASLDNGKPSFLAIFIRTLLRIVPFDFISYLVYSQGIHDTYSKTKLINTKNTL